MRVLFTILLVSICFPSFAAEYHNYLYPSKQMADPSVIQFDGSYYMYPTTDAYHVECYTSSDLVNWQSQGIVFQPDSQIHGSYLSPWKINAYAYDVKYYDGLFYLYYSSAEPSGHNEIGVAVAASPTGPFLDQSNAAPLISRGSASDVIDPYLFVDSNNDLYLYYAKYDNKFRVYVKKMLTPTQPAPDPEVLCIQPKYNWDINKNKFVQVNGLSGESILNEAPAVVKTTNGYALYYAANYANNPDYHLRVATSSSPLGPWVKQMTPVLQKDPSSQVYGPGSGCMVVAPDGVSKWFLCHQKSDALISFERYLSLNLIDEICEPGKSAFVSQATYGREINSPMLPLQLERFNGPALPTNLAASSGWNLAGSSLNSPAVGTLTISQNFGYEDSYVEMALQFSNVGAASEVTIGFPAVQGIEDCYLGWVLDPNASALHFKKMDSTGFISTLQTFVIPTGMSISNKQFTLRLSKQGNSFIADINGQTVGKFRPAAESILNSAAILLVNDVNLALNTMRYNKLFYDDFGQHELRGDAVGGIWGFAGGPGLWQSSTAGYALWKFGDAFSNCSASISLRGQTLVNSHSSCGLTHTIGSTVDVYYGIRKDQQLEIREYTSGIITDSFIAPIPASAIPFSESPTASLGVSYRTFPIGNGIYQSVANYIYNGHVIWRKSRIFGQKELCTFGVYTDTASAVFEKILLSYN